ncbi:MAG: hypothetical protein RIC19_21950 [Phaeodactylibacter sp.]|uniref:hypothetical protein n=1 Tax=Phaeodactylibacter sp. TaxID=1940289 RepID=UPI0032EDE55C
MRQFLFLVILMALSPTALLNGQRCSDNRPAFQGYSFINTNLISPAVPGARLFVDLKALEDYARQQGSPQVKGNLEEWQERFCDLHTVQDIGEVIYQSSRSDFEGLVTAVRSKRAPLPYRLTNNAFAKYLKSHQCIETATYLEFAKNCEYYATRRSPWESPQLRYKEMDDWITYGVDQLKEAKSHYIRLRYAYQVIRLAHYSKQYDRVLALCEDLLPKIDNDPSIIEDWIEGHRAGAMLALGQRVDAAYLFSRLFDRCPSKRESAYRSFAIRNDEEWQACLARCKTPEEEATLFAIRASFPNSKLQVEMQEIYQRDPDSPYLLLFLIQEMLKLERSLLGLSFNDQRQQNKFYYGVPVADAGQRVIRLQQFVTQVLKEGLVRQPGLWKMAQGYLSMLSGSFYDARKSFASAREMDLPPILKQQLDAFELVLYLNALQEINTKIENELVDLQNSNKAYQAFESFPDFFQDRLTDLYEENGQPGKAFLMQHPAKYLQPNIKPELIENLLAVTRKEVPSKLEVKLIADGDSTIQQMLLNIKASYLMSEYKFEAAIETLKRMERVDWDNYGLFNPFVERIRDCVHCPLPSNVPLYNKGELIEEILTKEYEAKAGTGNIGVLNYEIGLALYNTSYFGQAWKAMDFYRSGASLQTAYLRDGDNVTPHPIFPYGNQENFDCSRARLYFERARLATDSLELGAKATFMAAKCERNEYYVNRWRPDVAQSFENFELLVQNYAGTDFYQQVIKECLYFRAYANR